MVKKADKKVSKVEVEKLAKLSNLTLTPAEVGKFAELFTDTLKYMDVLNELDTSNTPETYQVTGLTNVFQKDGEKNATLSQEQALSNANEAKDGLFVTKAVFDRE